MRKISAFFIILLSITTLSAQWATDPAQNTQLATGNENYNEITFSTHEPSGNTFIQWCGGYANGWSPSIQKVDVLGHPQWGDDGIHISGPAFSSYSNGIAMCALADGGAVSIFADEAGRCIAVKINDDGTFAWGGEGIVALETNSCLRTQIVAGHNGGFWALCHDDNYVHCRYYHSDGTPGGDQITIADAGGKNVAFGQFVLASDDNVFVLYLKQEHAYTYYYNKSLFVAKYATDGTQLSQEEQLMDEVAISGQICHSVCPDGLGGGYAWICHPAVNDLFEVYLFHFDAAGHSTISAPTGLVVGQPDGINFHMAPDASLHPTSHDLLITFAEVDAMTQTHNGYRANRITPEGTKVWGDSGIIVLPITTDDISTPMIDAFADGTGAAIAYKFNNNTIKAFGIDANGTTTWHATIATPAVDDISLCDAASGFHNGQDIFAWQGIRNNTFGLYGQNLQQDGSLGPVSETSIENESEENISIYQSDNCLHIDGIGIQRIELVNMAGQLVKSVTTDANAIALGELPQGVYVVRVLTSDGKVVSRKVVKR